MRNQSTSANHLSHFEEVGHAELAIFDLDGTIIDTDASNTAAYRNALSKVGICSAIGMYGRVTAQVIRESYSLGSSDVDAIVASKVDAYCHELWRSKLGPAANQLKCILLNPATFKKIVLLTDSTERRALETLRHWDLTRYFDEIICNGGRGDKFANYFGSHDSDPAACVVWENEEGKIASAIAAGVSLDNIRKVG